MRIIILLIGVTFFSPILAQESYQSQKISIHKESVTHPKNIKETFNPQLIHHEAPLPDGNSIKSYILQQKIKSRKMFPQKKTQISNQKNATPSPIIGKTFKLEKKANGNVYPIYGGIPNDNTLAVSDDGIVLLGINSLIYAYDIKTDSILFPSSSIALLSVANGSSTQHYYDPKIIYDKAADRFILVFLKNSSKSS